MLAAQLLIRPKNIKREAGERRWRESTVKVRQEMAPV